MPRRFHLRYRTWAVMIASAAWVTDPRGGQCMVHAEEKTAPPARVAAPAPNGISIPEDWGGSFRKVAFTRQIGVAKETIECAERFQLLEKQLDPGPKESVSLSVRGR